MNTFETSKKQLCDAPKTWLVTGAAGFIGSHLVEQLLALDQNVVGLDNFSTGSKRNIEQALSSRPSNRATSRFKFIEGDIRNLKECHSACSGVDYVLHQAALGSVPRSLADPVATNQSNIDGFLNMLMAARDSGVIRLVYAASSSTYGDHPSLPKVEDTIGNPLSPYAVTKLVNELYANVFATSYGFQSIGLRYFNVFGPRQDPNGAYAAVVPRWIDAMIKGRPVVINGDGHTSRDFCYIENTVQANLLAATALNPNATNQVYNVAVGDRTTLNELFKCIHSSLADQVANFPKLNPTYNDFRDGDVRHSQADISKANNLLAYSPTHRLKEGIDSTVRWHLAL